MIRVMVSIKWTYYAPNKIGLAGESTFLLTAKIKDDQSTTKYQTASFTQAKNIKNFWLKNVVNFLPNGRLRNTKHHRGLAVFHREKWDVVFDLGNAKQNPIMF